MRGQAVHEERTGVGSLHHGAVDLIVGKVATALFVFFFKAHGGPDVGSHQIGALGSLDRITENGVVVVSFRDQRKIERITFGNRQIDVEAQNLSRHE